MSGGGRSISQRQASFNLGLCAPAGRADKPATVGALPPARSYGCRGEFTETKRARAPCAASPSPSEPTGPRVPLPGPAGRQGTMCRGAESGEGARGTRRPGAPRLVLTALPAGSERPQATRQSPHQRAQGPGLLVSLQLRGWGWPEPGGLTPPPQGQGFCTGSRRVSWRPPGGQGQQGWGPAPPCPPDPQGSAPLPSLSWPHRGK